MLEYLKKYNSLPPELRGRFSAPEIIRVVGDLEKKYNVSLATFIMRVLIKDIAVVDLRNFLAFEYNLDTDKAESLLKDLKANVFVLATDYLDFTEPEPVVEDSLVRLDHEAELAREKVMTETGLMQPSSYNNELLSERQCQIGRASGQQLLDKKMCDAMERIDYVFSSDDLNNRFKSIIETYLRGVRNKIDVKQSMVKDVSFGGLSMSEEAVVDIFKKIDDVKKKYDNPELLPFSNFRPREREYVKKDVISRDSEYDFGKLREDKIKKDLLVPESKNELVIQEEKPLMVVESAGVFSKFAKAKKDKLEQKLLAFHNEKQENEKSFDVKIVHNDLKYYLDKLKDGEEKKEQEAQGEIDGIVVSLDDEVKAQSEEKKAPALDNSVAVKIEKDIPKVVKDEIRVEIQRKPITQAPIETKKRMDDVKYVPKLISPVEELRIMSLVNFRRLSQSPETATNKIKEKIDCLEDDGGIAKKLEGVKAWRQSPLNKLYIVIGQEAISSTGGISAIIKKRGESHEEFLTEAEFLAIMDLNRNLRF